MKAQFVISGLNDAIDLHQDKPAANLHQRYARSRVFAKDGISRTESFTAYKPSEIVADFVHHSIEHDYDIAAGRFHLCLMKAARKEESVQRRQRMHDLKKSVPTCSYK
ncbi:hypothetical protein Y032_0015g2659 [Ancylostoma ceylanicum]|uniref:Uncharacterized protein n=1 Tax=Ancylostoma ceylanicum TaxID=53326 RepID=A0A016V9R4_9BILA|nr:hypothetical protein Y032_0015g2659 [Ancylostoma ceylanicum]